MFYPKRATLSFRYIFCLSGTLFVSPCSFLSTLFFDLIQLLIITFICIILLAFTEHWLTESILQKLNKQNFIFSMLMDLKHEAPEVLSKGNRKNNFKLNLLNARVKSYQRCHKPKSPRRNLIPGCSWFTCEVISIFLLWLPLTFTLKKNRYGTQGHWQFICMLKSVLNLIWSWKCLQILYAGPWLPF